MDPLEVRPRGIPSPDSSARRRTNGKCANDSAPQWRELRG